ncbi:MAG: hypothetical protein KI786_17360 [Mameliella sp.]|nr:hypothetical protein [Phaeodactylibacter sp.]
MSKHLLMNYSAKNIFLIDSLGALTTGVLLSQVLTRFVPYFGMPSKVLWVLAAIAFGLAIYSMLCHWLIEDRVKPFLTIIMVANASYCITTFGLMILFSDQLTWLGIGYFAGEIVIIILLLLIEYRVLSRA